MGRREEMVKLAESMMLENVKLILKNEDNNFILVTNNDSDVKTFEFSNSSEFISLMNIVEEPIRLTEVLTRISNEKELQLIHQLNAYMFIQLMHQNILYGVLCLGKKLTKTKFSAEDITLLRVLSDQITIALVNIELYNERFEKQRIIEELAVAHEIQRMLLPHEIPQGSNFEISAINIFSKEVILYT